MRSPILLAAALSVSCASTPMKLTSEPSPSPMPAPDTARLLSLTPVEFTASCDSALEKARGAVSRLKSMAKPLEIPAALRTYDEAIASLANAGAVASVARNAHPNAALRQAADKCEQDVEALSTEISLDRGVYDALSSLQLSGEDGPTRQWIRNALRDMRRAGVDRDEPTRIHVKALNEELVKIGQEFGDNIRNDVRRIELDPKELEGLPEDYLHAHKPGSGGKVAITTDTPDYVPFMAYAKSAKAREALWRTYRLRGHPKNLDVLSRLIAKRHELATLLGYQSWAAYITETKMVQSDQKAGEFLERLSRAAESRAQAEYQRLLERKKKEEPSATRVEPWDQDRLEDRVKAEQLGFDSQSARPYFEYRNVLAGVLEVSSKMFGISYRKVENAPVWHPDVLALDILEGSTLLGRAYLDMHPREGKYKHAAEFDLAIGQAGKRYPEAVLMCNFPKPGAEPALMQHQEVETFFHEFGHLLHHILGGRVRWAGISGIKTEWDFVEAPSMMLQEWASSADALQLFAKHYQSGQPIPRELVQRLVAAKEFGKGLWTRRQLFLAATSLNYYNRAPGFDTTLLMKDLQERYKPFRLEYVDGTYFQLSFGHLEGYSAIYYTYLWSLVIAKDLLSVFNAEGMLNPKPAQRYRHAILEAGGSKDAALLVQDFLGRPYDFKAYEAWLNAG